MGSLASHPPDGARLGRNRPQPMTPPDIDAFRHAADLGAWVWVESGDPGEHAEVHGGGASPVGLPDVGALFVASLREHFGAAASAVAERELDLHEGWHRALPSATVTRAMDCAESALSLLMARSMVLSFEYSAQLLGRGFVALCQASGVDAHALPPERREAIDRAMKSLYGSSQAPRAASLETELRRLLAAPAH
jgi:hypothetical protein